MNKQPLLLSIGGAIATAVAFGPARMGYGLFLPRFRAEFSLSTQTAGLIASAALAGFFLWLLLAAYLVEKRARRFRSLSAPRRPLLA